MLKVEEIRFEYESEPVLSGVSLIVNDSDRIGIVGPNGVGKTTLLRIIAGELRPQSGKIIKDNLLIGYLPQEIREYEELSCYDFLKKMTGVFDLEKEYNDLVSQKENVETERLGVVFEMLEHLGLYTFDNRMEKVFKQVGLDQVTLVQKVETLSGGEKRRLLLAAILLSKFDLILLDEPTNDLDLEGINILERFIRKSQSTFLIVTHDRRMLRTVTNKIADILPDAGRIDIYSLGYDEYLASREARKMSVEKTYEEFQDEKKRLDQARKRISKVSVRAEGNKKASDGEKLGRNAAREKAATKHAATARAISSRIGHLDEPEQPQKDISLSFDFKSSKNGVSEKVVSLEGTTVEYPGKTIGPFDITVMKSDRIVVTGPNGTGKTTLLNLIAGKITPSSGRVVLGNGIKAGLIDQGKTLPESGKTLLENARILSGFTQEQEPELRATLARFNFGEDKVKQLASRLSPGERTRLILATIVARETTLLLLDEPTNHLDIPAMEELEKALQTYPGTMVVVSHDREFLESLLPTRTLEVINGRLK